MTAQARNVAPEILVVGSVMVPCPCFREIAETAYKRHDWLIGAVNKRLREEFAKLQVEINDEKSRRVDLERGENFDFLGFDFRYLRSLRGVVRPHYTPKLKKRTALLEKRANAE